MFKWLFVLLVILAGLVWAYNIMALQMVLTTNELSECRKDNSKAE